MSQENTAPKMTVAMLAQIVEAQAAEILDLKTRLETLELTEESRVRPATAPSRKMLEIDAYRVQFGDLKLPIPAKKAAEILGLSAGQVYSVRGGYTFKAVDKSRTDLHEAMEEILANAEIEAPELEAAE